MHPALHCSPMSRCAGTLNKHAQASFGRPTSTRRNPQPPRALCCRRCSDGSAVQDYLAQLTGGRSVPRVFIEGRWPSSQQSSPACHQPAPHPATWCAQLRHARALYFPSCRPVHWRRRRYRGERAARWEQRGFMLGIDRFCSPDLASRPTTLRSLPLHTCTAAPPPPHFPDAGPGTLGQAGSDAAQCGRAVVRRHHALPPTMLPTVAYCVNQLLVGALTPSAELVWAHLANKSASASLQGTRSAAQIIRSRKREGSWGINPSDQTLAARGTVHE